MGDSYGWLDECVETGCDGIEFETGVWLGAHDGILLGR